MTNFDDQIRSLDSQRQELLRQQSELWQKQWRAERAAKRSKLYEEPYTNGIGQSLTRGCKVFAIV